jgi:hypothetical protein
MLRFSNSTNELWKKTTILPNTGSMNLEMYIPTLGKAQLSTLRINVALIPAEQYYK